jgi:hypothetical protein
MYYQEFSYPYSNKNVLRIALDVFTKVKGNNFHYFKINCNKRLQYYEH